MNIKDVESPGETSDRLLEIFRCQKGLMDEYHDIEAKNGVGLGATSGKFNVDDVRWQYLCKDYAWRITEEIAEATEALKTENIEHVREEIGDSLHFFVELFLIVGRYPDLPRNKFFEGRDQLEKIYTSIGHIRTVSPIILAYKTIEALGRGMNCLKNKPWKMTHMETDVARFHRDLDDAFLWFVTFAKKICTSDELYDVYFRKSKVNKFRQRSNY